MKMIFADTSGFAALRNRRDPYYQQAIAFQQQTSQMHLRLLTSNFVLDETYTWLRAHLGHGFAISFGTQIQKSAVIEIVDITPEIERVAWAIFVRYADKDFSYTDCTSFALMKQLQLDTAFTFDKHFQQFGFAVVPL